MSINRINNFVIVIRIGQESIVLFHCPVIVLKIHIAMKRKTTDRFVYVHRINTVHDVDYFLFVIIILVKMEVNVFPMINEYHELNLHVFVLKDFLVEFVNLLVQRFKLHSKILIFLVQFVLIS